MKKTLVLDDQPLINIALSLILEGAKSDLIHLATQSVLLDSIGPDVACVIVDIGSSNIDLPALAAGLKANAPGAGLVVMGKKQQDLDFVSQEISKLLWTESPFSDRQAISEFVTEMSAS